MNKRTKFYIGVTLVVSAITATVTFIALCFKKKSALVALATLAAAEGLVGLSLIEDNNVLKRKVPVTEAPAADAEDTDDTESIEEDVTLAEEAKSDDIA